jgi:hypothetical protein
VLTPGYLYAQSQPLAVFDVQVLSSKPNNIQIAMTPDPFSAYDNTAFRQ